MLCISIHLMLWFNLNHISTNLLLWNISIHLMLWFNASRTWRWAGRKNFNTSYVMVQHNGVDIEELVDSFQYILCYGSTSSDIFSKRSFKSFQYILCCGSTLVWSEHIQHNLNFNTSYVVVQPVSPSSSHVSPRFQYILCCGSTNIKYIRPSIISKISIHLMLWFNIKGTSIRLSRNDISIHLMLWFNAHPSEIITYVKDFNTSYVVVQRWILQRALIYFIISIHLMLWFNICFRLVQYIHIPHFNTSYVVVQRFS